jgi:hypothetical protein
VARSRCFVRGGCGRRRRAFAAARIDVDRRRIVLACPVRREQCVWALLAQALHVLVDALLAAAQDLER